jgi:hypothetical protein
MITEDQLSPLDRLDLAILKGLTRERLPPGGISTLSEFDRIQKEIIDNFPFLKVVYERQVAIAEQILSAGSDNTIMLGEYHPDYGIYTLVTKFTPPDS